MDTFDNFQYDTGSTYGGLPIVDDTSSVVSGFTTNSQARLPAELESLSSLSVSGEALGQQKTGSSADREAAVRGDAVDEELDGVLDDLKDESAVELPPHACRYVHILCRLPLVLTHDITVTVEFIHHLQWSSA